jgi:hypothetical protein
MSQMSQMSQTRAERLRLCTYTLMVEMLDLLAEDEVLEQRGASRTRLQAGLVLHGAADIRRHIASAVIYLVLSKRV